MDLPRDTAWALDDYRRARERLRTESQRLQELVARDLASGEWAETAYATRTGLARDTVRKWRGK